MSARFDRRTVLRGAGVALALPWLEALHARAGSRAPEPPRRVAWLYAPNGAHMSAWTPGTEGALETLPPTLEPLAAHRAKLLVLSGLALDKARANGDGAGDHARAAASFLTGAQPFKTDGANLRAGVSADQVAAQTLGNRTRLRSLEIGCEGGALSGQCDSGYSCAYSSTISWRTPNTPLPKETDPRLVFERLFLDGAELSPAERAERARRRKSVLDFAREDAKALAAKFGANDQRKLDEYASSVRELERRIEAAERDAAADVRPDERPNAKPKDYAEHLKLLSDLLVLAFRTDTTRIATFTFANEGSNRSYAFLGAPEGHHDLSHHGGEAQKLEKVAKINRFHVEQLAYLLDRTTLVYGSGIGDGNRHNHEELPILVAGGGLAGGRHVRVPTETPLANLHLSLLRRFGVDAARHGDSTGELGGIWV
ncbi:MAG: DUF1552 domain-containing protein [Planctomycetes bacterium]|nr:DUF1552 domain-containing protein [Planctomycetota bacterium]